jgi:hypothetical protein
MLSSRPGYGGDGGGLFLLVLAIMFGSPAVWVLMGQAAIVIGVLFVGWLALIAVFSILLGDYEPVRGWRYWAGATAVFCGSLALSELVPTGTFPLHLGLQ